MTKFVFVLSAFMGIGGALLLSPTVSYGAEKGNGTAAIRLIQSASSLTLAPREQTRFGIGFKNTGSVSWRAGDDKTFVLRSRAKNESYFYHSSWQNGNTIMAAPQDTKSGEVVYFWFTLEAPQKEGAYQEEFALYNGNKKIERSVTRVPIAVKKGTTVPVAKVSAARPTVAAPTAPAQTVSAQLSALKLVVSAQSLVMKQYERTTFRIGFKNTSGVPWLAGQQPPITLRSKASKESYFYDQSWMNGTTVMALSGDTRDGEIAYFDFTLFAPIYPRDFQEALALYVGDKKITGSDVNIPITVVPASTPILTTAPSSVESGATFIETQPPPESVDSIPPTSVPVRPGIIESRTQAEPFIRVGLYYTTDPVRMTANKEYEVRDSDGTVLAHEVAGVPTTIVFDTVAQTYTVTTPTTSLTTSKYVRLRGAQVPYRTVPRPDGTIVVEPVADQDTIFEILSYSNHPAWSTTVNDNTFRGEMEVRYAPATARLWVVNELLFEQYLKGIAETSNSSPFEYQKALIIAARTYAKYHIDRNSKHAAEGFTVRPTEADQVYRGYGAEKRLPNVSRAVDETRGVMVYYNGTLAITPYSSNTDGRTRSWEEVWGGPPKPWLVSVPDPCCTGLAMRYSPTSYSHGVGMSARGALAMALDNKGFEEILKYYYTTIELIRNY